MALEIEQVRFGERLRFEEAVAPEALPCRVPALVLQPLLENAVKHGLAHLVEGGTISLEAEVEDERLTVTIANPIDPDGPPTHGDGIGLRNVIGRLQLLYRGNGRLETAHGADRFEAILELPTRPEGADRSPS